MITVIPRHPDQPRADRDPAKVLAEMGIAPGMIVVHLCCGDGLFAAPLARIALRVYAVDLDPAMLDRARACVAATGARNCRLIVADAMTIDAVVPEPVDYVFLANTTSVRLKRE